VDRSFVSHELEVVKRSNGCATNQWQQRSRLDKAAGAYHQGNEQTFDLFMAASGAGLTIWHDTTTCTYVYPRFAK